jgi:predicted nucleotidyltransferase
MPTLTEASLTEDERRAVDRFVDLLSKAFGQRLVSVWLYGSRARGERPHDESDVDVLVVVDEQQPDDLHTVVQAACRAEEAAGVGPVLLSPLVYGVDRVAQRREIRSFFIQEVDRDKIVLFGEP